MTDGPRRRGAAAGCLALLLTAGCASPAAHSDPTQSGDTAPPPAARQGSEAPARVTFEPEQVTLPGGASAPVQPARTVDGELVVPENVRHVGWWDGSAAVGDAFGSTVIAGHVDSATEGLGYFARLLRIEKGDRVTVSAGEHRLDYRIVSARSVTKKALATSSRAFDQTGEHRLVLITCTGSFRPGRGYDSNLVVTGEPVGRAR